MSDSDNPAEIFAQRLKNARDLRGLSQTELAAKAKLPPSSISHFEANARKPSFENLRRLATALDVTTDYLLGRVSESSSVGGAEKIHRHLENLTQSDLDLADNFLKMLAERNKLKGAK